MQFLCLLIFIGVTKCDDSNTVVPASYDHLGVPNACQYVSQYTLSVQTSYVTSVECMLSSNHYIQSGFSEIDSASNTLATNLITQFKDGVGNIQNMMFGMESDEDKESEEKINAVVSMTVNYYQKKEVTVEKTETKLGEITQVEQAQSILTARRCESDYTSFMNDVTTIKSKYSSETASTDKIDKNQWGTLVNQYYDARENIVNNTNVYASIREAFLLGSGINLCDEGSANTDQSLLEIYKADDLSKYFGKTDNDASALFSQTVTQMYTIYKNSLTVIYLKSVVHTKSDLAMRVTIWEQVNLVRANFEYMSQNIDSFIKSTTSDAESSYGANSEEYKTIMISLYTCVNKMLLTIVKYTEVHYKRALNFNPDRSMIKTDFNQYKVEIIENYYETTASSNAYAFQYDIRVIDKERCSYPTPEICIPQDMYSLVINKLMFQVFISQVNYINIQIKSTKYETTLDSWIYEKITVVDLHNSFIFSKCSVTTNKMLIINSATFSYVLLTTEQSTESNEIQQILDQIANDVVGTLCVNTLRITDTSTSVNVFVDKNGNPNTAPVVYKPGFSGNPGQNNPGQNNPGQNNPGQNNPGQNNPGQNNPGQNNPGQNNPGQSSPPTSGTYSPQSNSPPTTGGSSPSTSGNQPTNNGGAYSPQPGTNSPQPGTNSPQPGTNSPQPGTNSPQPGTNSPQPGTNSPQPGTNSPQPGTYSPQPNSPPPTSGSQPNNSGSSNPPSNSPPTNGGSSTPPNGNQPTNNGGAYSPEPNSPPTTGGSSPPTSGSPPTGSTGTPTSSGTYNPQPGGATNNNPGNGNSPNNGYYTPNPDYVYVKSGTQITKTIELSQSRIQNKITSSFTNVQNTDETEYTKVVKKSLEISQEIVQYNVDYLGITTSDAIKYISEVTSPDSDEYLTALIAVFRDTQEKTSILTMTLDIPCTRTYYLNSTEYVDLNQTVIYAEFVHKFYEYFEVNCDEIYTSDNDADLFLKNSITQFNKIYEMVITAVQQTQDDAYKEYLICYLEKTLAVYKQTTGCFQEQIVQTKQLVSQQGDGSILALYHEITQRMDSITVIYSSVLIKSYQYSKSSTTVTIFDSEYDVITVQTNIVSSYEYTIETTSILEIEVSA